MAAELLEPAQRPQERLLDGVFDLPVRSEQAPGPSDEFLVVVLGDDREGVRVACEVQEDEFSVGVAPRAAVGPVGVSREGGALLDRQRFPR